MSEKLIIAAIRDAFPAGQLPGRGVGPQPRPWRKRVDRPRRSPTGDRRMWIIDPLDGTVNYANGIPVFCVSIGLAVDGKPVLGVVYDPVRDELFTAVPAAARNSTASDPSSREGPVVRLRRLAVIAARAGPSATARSARASASRAPWAVPRSPSRTWATAASTGLSSRWPVAVGHLRGRTDRGRGRCRRDGTRGQSVVRYGATEQIDRRRRGGTHPPSDDHGITEMTSDGQRPAYSQDADHCRT